MCPVRASDDDGYRHSNAAHEAARHGARRSTGGISRRDFSEASGAASQCGVASIHERGARAAKCINI